MQVDEANSKVANVQQIKKFVTKQLNKRIEAWKKKRKEKVSSVS